MEACGLLQSKHQVGAGFGDAFDGFVASRHCRPAAILDEFTLAKVPLGSQRYQIALHFGVGVELDRTDRCKRFDDRYFRRILGLCQGDARRRPAKQEETNKGKYQAAGGCRKEQYLPISFIVHESHLSLQLNSHL